MFKTALSGVSFFRIETAKNEFRYEKSIFENHGIAIVIDNSTETLQFDTLQHVQQPMIEKVVEYFSDKAENPCPPEAGVKVMEIMQSFTEK